MKRVSFGGLTVMACLVAGALTAHPHVFIATSLSLQTDAQGRLLGVEVSWRYDELYSLLILEDMGLDPDYDGVLTEEELAALAGFDLNWMEGYEGDLYLTAQDAAVPLAAPQYRGIAFTEGQIVSTHFRPLETPLDGTVLVQAYDPTFYTAYDLSGGVTADDGCTVAIDSVDLNAAYDRLEEILFAMPEADTEGEFPEVGREFADKIEVTCNVSG